jgi:hypothetical protein
MSEAEKPEAAHILFPDDKPRVPEKAPDWFNAQQSAARARLAGQHAKPDAKPDDAKSEPEADAARELFKDDAPEFKGSEVFGFLETRRMAAIEAGDEDHATELADASKALTEDAVKHGTPTEDFAEAMDAFRERHDFIQPPSEDAIREEYESSIETLRSELGDSFESDINAAQKFIADLEKVAPGTIESLAVSGAGNDRRIIKAAIKEARRRGY